MLGRVMVAIGGAIVLVLFGALLAPFIVDWSSFRVEFEQQASRVLGKKVSVHGEVDARILPFPSITLHDVRVGQDVDGQPQAQVARFSMDMELAPFLSGEARIFDMRVEEPRLRVRILKDGTLDWMRGSRPAIPTRIVVIEDVHVSGGQISVIDEQSGRAREVAGLSAEMSAASLFGPWRAEGNATLDGEEARFSLATGTANTQSKSLPLRLRLWPDDEPVEVNLEGNLAFVDNVATYGGSFAATILDEEDETEPVAAPPPRPRMKGSFKLTNERIRVADYRLEVGSLDDPYVVTGEATLDTGARSEFLLTAEGQQIDVNRLGPQGTKGKTGRDGAASAQRRLQAFVEMAASIPIPQVPGRASLKLPALVLNDTTIRDIQLDVRPAGDGWTVDSAIATLPGRTRMEAKGALVLRDSPSFKGDMLFASTQPSGLADWLSGNVDPAIRQLRTAGFSAKVDLTTTVQRFDDLELGIGGATLKGRLVRQSQGTQSPGLSVELSGDEINLDAMRALASLMTGEDAGRSVLDHRLEANLKAQRVTAFGVTAETVDTRFTLDGGVLSLSHLSIGDVAGAQITAVGRLEGSTLAYQGTADVALRAADAGDFLAMLRQQLPPHPVLNRLAANAGFYTDTALDAKIRFGAGGSGASAAIAGSINGSAVQASVDLPTVFNLTGEDALSLSATLENPQSQILLGQAGIEILPFGGDGAGSLSLDMQQSAGAPAKTRLEFKTERTELSASLDTALASDRFGEGRGHVSLRSRDIEPYLLLTGVGIPQFGAGLPLTVESDFVVTAGAIQLAALRGQADGNGFEGDLSIDRAGPSLKAQGAIRLDSADLAWFGEAVFGPLTDPATGGPSETGFALPVFGESDVALDIRAKEFGAGAFGTVANFSTKLTHRGGSISMDKISGDWRGGKLGGRLTMTNANGTGILQSRIRAEGADLASLVWKRDGRPVATGRATLEASAEASGGSARELTGALTGSGVLSLSGARIDGLNSALLDGLMMDVDGAGRKVDEADIAGMVSQKVHDGSIDLGDLDVPFTITSGELRVQGAQARAGNMSLALEGRGNLTAGAIDAMLALTYDAADEAPAGGDPTVRLIYSGDRTQPDESVDAAPMANFLTMRAYEQERRRVEMLQSSVLEKQRLRREVALYNFRAAEREAEKARKAAEDEQARQALIAAARAAEEERRREANQLRLDLPPGDDYLTPPAVGQDNPFDPSSLPGVGQ